MAKQRKPSPVSNPSSPAAAASRPATAQRPANAPRPARRVSSGGSRGSRQERQVMELLRYAALAALCVLIWCTVYERLGIDSWSVPVEYGLQPDRADVKSNLAGIKSAADGNYLPFLFHGDPRLGAPYGAEWNDYPTTEDIMFWAAGVLGRVIGIFAASNFTVMAVQVLAALAFYYAARRLKCDWRWGFAGALFFAMAPFAFAHSLHHLVITAYWHVALGIMVCYWLANGNGLKMGTRDYYIAVGVAVVTGWMNIYFTNIFIQMVGISLIIQWIRRGWRAAIPSLTIGCAAVAAAALMALKTLFYHMLHGHNAGAIQRNYGQTEYYALKFIDLFIPFPTHRIPPLAEIGQRFYSMTVLPAEIPPACYFGFVGIAAFLWLLVVTVRNAIARDRRRIPFEAVLALWVFLYATVGGINGMVGLAGFELFRSTTRYCIVIFCLALLFAVRRLSLISTRWKSPWPFLAPLIVTVIGLWEFLPPVAGEDTALTRAWIGSDQTFAMNMEASLPKGGMVFQLPVMDFPENPIPNISAYDHFRPFLFTKNLRFSFGSDKGRAEDAWQRVIVGMQPADQIAALERYGFSGIYINTMGYPDRAQGLLEKYKAAGRGSVIASPQKDLVCVILQPSLNPVLPPPGPFFASGWYAEQDSGNGEQRDHLASGDAVLILKNESGAPVDKYVSFFIASLSPRSVTMQGAGAFQIWPVDQRSPQKVENLKVTLQPGDNQITFTSNIPASPAQMGPVSFDVVNFTLNDSAQ